MSGEPAAAEMGTLACVRSSVGCPEMDSGLPENLIRVALNFSPYSPQAWPPRFGWHVSSFSYPAYHDKSAKVCDVRVSLGMTCRRGRGAAEA